MALLSGKILAERILSDLKQRIEEASLRPGLAVLLVGDYIESHKYVALKEERARAVGIHFEKQLFPATVTQDELLSTIQTLNHREDIHGILVQLPLPERLPTDEIIAAIDPKKDVDGFHPGTLKRFLSGDKSAYPVFPRAVLELIRATGVHVEGERGVAVVNSDLLGQILVAALLLEGIEAKYVLSKLGKAKITEALRGVRIVVTACGIPDLVTAKMLSPDVIVIDGGNVHVAGKVRGDIERESVEPKSAWLSPVPGGVGPLTIAFLLTRTVELTLGSRASK